MRTNKLTANLFIILITLAGLVLATTCIYSTKQLKILKQQPVYTNPEDGMRELVLNQYFEIDKVEIAHSGKEVFNDLYFVEVNVWATNRIDGKGFIDTKLFK